MMQALELQSYDEGQVTLVEKPIPQPGPNEVLIRIAATPANPSDLMFLRGLYGIKKPLPVVPGFEGSGVVVGGSGLIARALRGRRVVCLGPDQGDGTWAEYMVTPVSRCFPLRRHVTLEQGAMLFVNPLTAWALVDMARRAKQRAIVQTAAASALGRMVLNLAQRYGIEVIHVVRRDEQVALLQGMGARYVLNSEEQGFDRRLRELCKQLGATLAFDAVAGELTGRVLEALGRNGRIVVYGALSEQAVLINPGAFIFKNKRVEGFWLSTWLTQGNPLVRLRAVLAIQDLLGTDLRTEVQARIPLAEATQGLAQYADNMTGGKLLFTPDPRLLTI